MTDSESSSILTVVRDQAVRWMVRLQSGDATTVERRQFEVWLAEHVSHRQEFEQLSKIWTTLDRTKPLLEAELREAETLWDHDRSTVAPTSRRSLWQWSRLPVGVTALAVLLLVASWWWMTQPPAAILYQTAKGEQRHVVLADGSLVMLNTETTLTAQFLEHQRFVWLDRGEAWFTVTHDERRPFHVQVANGTVRDIGTQFIVHKTPHEVQVSVVEGIVEVGLIASNESVIEPRPAILHQGEQVRYDADGHVSAIERFDRATVGAWKDGKLIFQAQPLGQALTEMARYRSEEIRLLDPSLADIPVSGSFNIKNLESFIQALEDALPIHATRVTPQLVIVERAPALPNPPKISNR